MKVLWNLGKNIIESQCYNKCSARPIKKNCNKSITKFTRYYWTVTLIIHTYCQHG